MRRKLGRLLDSSLAMLPREDPAGGWDALQEKVRSLQFSRAYRNWEDDTVFLNELTRAFGGNQVTQYKWGVEDRARKAAKALGEEWESFKEEGGSAHQLHAHWLAYRYPITLRFGRAAAGVYQATRLRSGHLTFQDLLLFTARLLREHPDVRRELGRRYRYLLIDEFQDTDPLQAEVVFLLASEPESGSLWNEVQLRAGALFVVGDPKQSIYRFRRADIALYGQVKRRFREVGEVVELVANFRSTQPVERLVNAVFSRPDRFPPEETLHQASFAPLRVRPARREREGVFWYRFDRGEGNGAKRIHEPEGARLASWIADRVRRKERSPGDFMILTRTRKALASYARALEERNVPVQVTGAGVGVEEELSDLVLLLQALCDPGNEVLTLAVLEGLFFGFSHEQLYEHVLSGGNFSFLRVGQPASSVTEALNQLREFWRMSRGDPADVVVPRIVEMLGILPFAAAGELGATRAGALLYALDALHTAALDGATSLIEAVEVLQAALDQEEAEAPLFPGEGDVVRLMNLHKAKGLEAPVVVLADPSKPGDHRVQRHITRDGSGRAVGYLLVQDDTGFRSKCIARPLDWEAYERDEAPFEAAEVTRLLYVAATRARDELVVGRCSETEEGAFWTPLHAALDRPDLASELRIVPAPPVERERMRVEGDALQRRSAELAEARAEMKAHSYRSGSVTRLAKGEQSYLPAGPGAAGARGASWGTAVHEALEAMGAGHPEADLLAVCREILLGVGRVDELGEPAEAEELARLVIAVRGSELWRRAEASPRKHQEVPFLVAFRGEELRGVEGIVATDPGAPGVDRLVEGVIDLAFLEPGRGWVIADYKTDVFASEAARAERTAIYRRQVDLYALCWERITGEAVAERQLYFTAGDPVVW